MPMNPDNKKSPALTDQQIETTISNLLRGGVILAAVVCLIGGALYLLKYGGEQPHYRVFTGERADLKDIPGILNDALSRSPRGLIQFGLLLLIATPVARVAFSVYGFLRQHDRLYVVFTLIVLAILLHSLFGGFA